MFGVDLGAHLDAWLTSHKDCLMLFVMVCLCLLGIRALWKELRRKDQQHAEQANLMADRLEAHAKATRRLVLALKRQGNDYEEP